MATKTESAAKQSGTKALDYLLRQTRQEYVAQESFGNEHYPSHINY
jgi:hypothetical protein